MSPQYDPWLEKEVPTPLERQLSGHLEDIRREVASMQPVAVSGDSLAWFRILNQKLDLVVLLVLVFGALATVSTLAVAVKVWFFS